MSSENGSCGSSSSKVMQSDTIVKRVRSRSGRCCAIAAIRDYCEADCANTYLLFLRFQLMRCALTKEQYARECSLLKSFMEKQNRPHWAEFLSLWKN